MKKQKRKNCKGIKWGLVLLYIGILALGIAAWVFPILALVAWLGA